MTTSTDGDEAMRGALDGPRTLLIVLMDRPPSAAFGLLRNSSDGLPWDVLLQHDSMYGMAGGDSVLQGAHEGHQRLFGRIVGFARQNGITRVIIHALVPDETGNDESLTGGPRIAELSARLREGGVTDIVRLATVPVDAGT